MQIPLLILQVLDSIAVGESSGVYDTTEVVIDSVAAVPISPSEEVISQMQRLGGSVSDVVQNTAPLDFGMGNLGWWNFGIGIAALIAGVLAAFFAFLGFRYQKRAAISLEGREGKAFQFDMIIRLIWSSITSLLAFHDAFQKGRPVPMNRIETLKIPQDLIDPALFTSDSRTYTRTVQFKRDITRLNLDVDSYKTYYGIDKTKEEAYVDKLITQMFELIDSLGVTMGLLDYPTLYRQYIHDQRKRYKEELLFSINPDLSDLSDMKEGKLWEKILFVVVWPLVFFTGLFSYLKRYFGKEVFHMRTHYYCTNIAQAILNEHFDIIRTLEKAKAPKLVSFTFVLPQSIELFLKDKQWNEKVFAGSVQYEYKDLVAGFFVREFADQPDVRKKFPHMNCYRKKEAMPLDQFVKSALALETALKAEDALFLM